MIAELQARIAELQDQVRDELAATMRVETVTLWRFGKAARAWLAAVQAGRTVILTLSDVPLARLAPLPGRLIPDTPRVDVGSLHRPSRAAAFDRLTAGGPVILLRFGRPVGLLVPVNP